MMRSLLTAALVSAALAKGVALGVGLGLAGATCARCACRKLRPKTAAPAPTEEAEA